MTESKASHLRSTTAGGVAVLTSGGLDSAVLLGDMLTAGHEVHPVYVRGGLIWEEAELYHLRQFLAAVARPNLRPLTILEVPLLDLYGEHWAISGKNTPGIDSPDAAAYLPGRNILMVPKVMVWCHLNGIATVVLGHLAANPFPDATEAFFTSLERIANEAVKGSVQVIRPFASLIKAEVVLRGAGYPLDLTFSCLRPIGNEHCFSCNKCEERRLVMSGS